MAANKWAGLTPAQKAKVRKQMSSRLGARAKMRAAVARRTGTKVGDLKRKVGVGLALTNPNLSAAERAYAKAIRGSKAGKAKIKADYKTAVKKAYKSTVTDPAKTKITTKVTPGSMKTGAARDTARAWRQNQVASLKKRKAAGKISAAEFVDMRDKVIRRHKKMIGA